MEGYFNTPMKALENLKKVVARTNSNKTGKELMNLILDVSISQLFFKGLPLDNFQIGYQIALENFDKFTFYFYILNIFYLSV